jgi:glutathione S-transferase
LNIKGIAHKTVWIELVDIERVAKEIGCKPTSNLPDGSPFYTVPMIQDPRTEIALSDSIRIVQYLDDTYPNTPRMIPTGTASLHLAFESALRSVFTVDLAMHYAGIQLKFIKEKSRTYYRELREKVSGKKLEEFALSGLALEEQLDKLEKSLATVASWYQEKDSAFFVGKSLGFADVMLASSLGWCRALGGEESIEWKKLMSIQDGHWKRLMQTLEQYEVVY